MAVNLTIKWTSSRSTQSATNFARILRNGNREPKTWFFRSQRHFGQPVSLTHPHLLDDGQLTPGISASEYKLRRERLVNGIIDTRFFKKDNDHVIVIPGTNQKYMTKNIPYKFKQNTDLHYLTGFLEPDSCLVLVKSRGSDDFETIFFVPETNEEELVWRGPGSGVNAATQIFQADRAFKNSELKKFLEWGTASYGHWL